MKSNLFHNIKFVFQTFLHSLIFSSKISFITLCIIKEYPIVGKSQYCQFKSEQIGWTIKAPLPQRTELKIDND